MDVGFAPSMKINSGVFQRETRNVQSRGFEGFKCEMVRRGVVRLNVVSVILDARIDRDKRCGEAV